MSTVRIERCPECDAMVGEGMLYEHQQRHHKPKVAPGAPDIPAPIARLKLAHRDERHHTNRETHYWCRQYRLLAQDMADALTSLSASHEALTQERDMLNEENASNSTDIISLVRQIAEQRIRAEAAEAQLAEARAYNALRDENYYTEQRARVAAEAQVAALTARLRLIGGPGEVR
jgi:hypothetical protein